MKLRFINRIFLNTKAKFILYIGVVLGMKLCFIKINTIEETVTPTIERSIEDMTMSEKLLERGGFHIYFINKEYCTDPTDSIAFFNNRGEGQGVVTNMHDEYIITFIPGGEYSYFIHSLGVTGSFVINDVGEQYQMIIDYKTMTYKIESITEN